MAMLNGNGISKQAGRIAHIAAVLLAADEHTLGNLVSTQKRFDEMDETAISKAVFVADKIFQESLELVQDRYNQNVANQN